MKTIVIAPSCKQLLYSIMIFGLAAFTSCKKETAKNNDAITSEEAAEIMSESVVDEESGAAAYFEGHASVTASTSDSAECIFNETIQHTGSFISNLRRKLTFTRKTTMKVINVIVNRATRKVVSGTIEIVIEGTNSAGEAFYYTGTFTFEGNSHGTLALQNGQSFTLQW